MSLNEKMDLYDLAEILKYYKITNPSKALIQSVLLDCALQQINNGVYGDVLSYYINNESNNDVYNNRLLESFLEGIDRDEVKALIKKYPDLFKIVYHYDKYVYYNTLGNVYLLLINKKIKKNNAIFYTHVNIIVDLVFQMNHYNKSIGNYNFENDHNLSILDPCCGSGLFLIRLLEYYNKVKLLDRLNMIHGIDINPLLVKISRLNVYLISLTHNNGDDAVDKNTLIDIICNNIVCANYLDIDKKFDYTIGNPPWGYKYNKEEKEILSKKYYCAQNSQRCESFDIFLEHAINHTNKLVSFILPESILSTKCHSKIRSVILDKTNPINIDLYGENLIDDALCRPIGLHLKNTNEDNNQLKIQHKIYPSYNKEILIDDVKNDWRIRKDLFNVYVSDFDFDIIEQIIKNINSMKDNIVYFNKNKNCKFNIGIITGNNKKFIYNNAINSNCIPICIGTNVYLYSTVMNDTNTKYIDTNNLNKFQQVISNNIYNAPEKLLYRFINNYLIFAYDDKQLIPLNSVNCILPTIKDINIKYILACLNSNLIQYYNYYKFNQLKILQSTLEQLPIVIPDKSSHDQIVELTNNIIKLSVNSKERIDIKQSIDNLIFKLYNCDDTLIDKINQCIKYYHFDFWKTYL